MIIIHHCHYHHHHHHHIIIIAIITMQIISPFRIDLFQSFFCKLNKIWINAFFPGSETARMNYYYLGRATLNILLFRPVVVLIYFLVKRKLASMKSYLSRSKI